MAFVRPEDKEINFKIVVWGPPCSGKTTFLTSLRRELFPSKGKAKKDTPPERTLFFDFLPLKLDKIRGLHARLHLYTVPGQAPYRESRSLLVKGADGLIVVLDSQLDRDAENTASLRELETFLHTVGETLESIPLIFAYNKQDAVSALPPEDMNTLYNSHNFPSFATVACDNRNVLPAFSSLLEKVIKGAQ